MSVLAGSYWKWLLKSKTLNVDLPYTIISYHIVPNYSLNVLLYNAVYNITHTSSCNTVRSTDIINTLIVDRCTQAYTPYEYWMWLLPYAAQNYHPLLYHNCNETCCLLFPFWIATHAHTNAGRLRLAKATLSSDKERKLWRHIPALISLPKMLCNTYTQI